MIAKLHTELWIKYFSSKWSHFFAANLSKRIIRYNLSMKKAKLCFIFAII